MDSNANSYTIVIKHVGLKSRPSACTYQSYNVPASMDANTAFERIQSMFAHKIEPVSFGGQILISPAV